MTIVAVIFWFSFLVVFYAFFGYGIVIYALVKITCRGKKQQFTEPAEWMPATLVVPCYNEADILEMKIKNCRDLDYPKDKLTIMFITDGSTDNSPAIIEKHTDIVLLHSPVRAGKSAAENRAIKHVKTPVVIFTDANTVLNKEAAKNIVRHFYNEKVGCVSGEKRVITSEADGASASEGLYWKYESFLKNLDSQFYSAVGAAGELVAFKTALYQDMPHDTLLDDFIQSMSIAAKGYKIVYEPEAYAMETPSANVKEEIKRKVRICAGGWQSITRLWPDIGWFKNAKLAFQYYSHRVLRWTVTPFLMIIMFFASLALAVQGSAFYILVFAAQFCFYGAAFLGYLFEAKNIRLKLLYVPFYFCMMNWAVMAGLRRFLKGNQSALWEKAGRSKNALIQ